MKGLIDIPSNKKLTRCYERLQFEGVGDVSESELALWSQWARFDPRLGELLVSFLLKKWRRFSPVKLNDELLSQPWPSAFGVLVSHTQLENMTALFEKWADCALAAVSPSSGGQYFIGLEKFGGRRMASIAERTTSPYLDWGYLGSENLLRKSFRDRSPRRTVLDKKRRRVLLDKLMRKQKLIRVEDYLTALEHKVSRRQAERDLASHSRLRAKGFTRSRVYQVR